MSARTVPTLPSFSTNQVLTASEMTQIMTWNKFWANPPMFRMYQTAVQSIPNLTFTQITCDVSDYDSDSGRGLATPWSYTIPVGMSGRWRFSCAISWAANATGVRGAAIYVNGAQANGAFWAAETAPATNVPSVGGATTIAVNAGDQIALYGEQGSGGALNTNTAVSLYSYLEGKLESLASP